MQNKAIGNLQPITLPEPIFNGCESMFEALKKRRTSRSINDKPVSIQVLSDILWAGQGVNRLNGPFGGPGRTAASASNSQEICVYVAREEATYLYDPDYHRMMPVVAGDIRTLAIGPGQGRAGANTPLRLIYVVDLEKFNHAGFPEPGLYDSEIQKSYYFVDTGLIAQNIYLAAFSLGLGSWFHNCNKPEIEKVLKLNSQQRALFGHSIGYVKD
jgi:nitroreductase